MVGESNQNVLLIQIDASTFAEFEISEFEIARVDCINQIDYTCWKLDFNLLKINIIVNPVFNKFNPTVDR